MLIGFYNEGSEGSLFYKQVFLFYEQVIYWYCLYMQRSGARCAGNSMSPGMSLNSLCGECTLVLKKEKKSLRFKLLME